MRLRNCYIPQMNKTAHFSKITQKSEIQIQVLEVSQNEGQTPFFPLLQQ